MVSGRAYATAVPGSSVAGHSWNPSQGGYRDEIDIGFPSRNRKPYLLLNLRDEIELIGLNCFGAGDDPALSHSEDET